MGELDFSVSVHTIEYIVPIEHHEAKQDPLFLSNIDQTVLLPVETLYFYRSVVGRSTTTIANDLKNGLRKVLRSYPFLTGRHRLTNDVIPRLEIDCNGAGVQFAAAQINATLDDMGDLAQPNPFFRNFIPQPYKATTIGDCPLVMIQVTSFRCGGFVFGMTMMHTCCDGISALEFLINFSAYCKDVFSTTCIYPPLHDRTLLKASQVPQPLYDHNEYICDNINEVQESNTSSGEMSTSAFQSTTAAMKGDLRIMQVPEKICFKTFPISLNMIHSLKHLVKDAKGATSFDVVTAHIWQARTKAIVEVEHVSPDQLYSVLYAVDIRSKISPPLPRGYCGNAVIPASARATAKDLQEKSLLFCVNEVQEASKKITDAYIKSCLDWLEIYRGRPAIYGGNFFVSSWWRLPFSQVDFGWGSPVYAGPVVTPMTEFVVFLPNGKNDGGLNLRLALSPETMEKFEQHFLEPFVRARL